MSHRNGANNCNVSQEEAVRKDWIHVGDPHLRIETGTESLNRQLKPYSKQKSASCNNSSGFSQTFNQTKACQQ